MAEEPVLNRETVLGLLRPPGNIFVTEDIRHSWSDNHFPSFTVPLLRIWDYKSGSQPDYENRMMSRAPRQRLYDERIRRNSLTTHINHKVWERTPYISFTSSPLAIQDMSDWRTPRRGAQNLTVINPNVRIQEGLPILDIRAEMDYYEIRDPYKRGYQYYTDYYICLWEVTEQEIVGHWPWDDLAQNTQWYNDIILPTFMEHNRNAMARSFEEDLSAAINEISSMFIILGQLYSKGTAD